MALIASLGFLIGGDWYEDGDGCETNCTLGVLSIVVGFGALAGALLSALLGVIVAVADGIGLYDLHREMRVGTRPLLDALAVVIAAVLIVVYLAETGALSR